jgi:hypothetical protein
MLDQEAQEAIIERISRTVAGETAAQVVERVELLIQLHGSECPAIKKLAALENRALGQKEGMKWGAVVALVLLTSGGTGGTIAIVLKLLGG